MMKDRFPHSGNYPSSEDNPRDKLVQWSHGATGMSITLCNAARVFSCDREFRDAAIEAGEVVWRNGLVRKVGLSDGVSGNAYAFLSDFIDTHEHLIHVPQLLMLIFVSGHLSIKHPYLNRLFW
uniref:LanC-like protein GCL1 n=1 Tax=Nelumbo nucifera TaxID=4432 RepID=A0A822Z8F2_NELNU|nr:TPA_asm: hypothetical protein HUJ06_015448 [Nelumbo nucifera]DAD41127.1 TPA_asm: hypothetical protein HUJ06_015450 [Nelumbo nucifera]